MKYSMLIAGLVAAIGAGSAVADEFSYDVNMAAEVVAACASSGNIPALENGNFSAVTGSQATFTVVIDSIDGSVAGNQEDELTFDDVFCNTASDVTLTRTGLNHESVGPSNGLVAHIDYAVSVDWGGPGIVALAAGGGNSATTPNVSPRSGQLFLNIFVPDTTTGLVGGSYSDTVTLTVSPTS